MSLHVIEKFVWFVFLQDNDHRNRHQQAFLEDINQLLSIKMPYKILSFFDYAKSNSFLQFFCNRKYAFLLFILYTLGKRQ